MRNNQLGMHLRIFGPVDVAIHMMDRVVTIVACEPIDHGAGEVPGRVHVHLGTFMFSQDDVLCPIMLKHIPQLKHITHRARFYLRIFNNKE